MLIVSTAILTIFTINYIFSIFTIIFEVLVNVAKRKKVYKKHV